MEPTNDMCPTCNVAVVDGVCPQCGAKKDETVAPAPTTEEATAPTEATPEV